jgi:hypothetical protein
MKPKRWMEKILEAAKDEQIEMPWSRSKRAAGRAAKPSEMKAAG